MQTVFHISSIKILRLFLTSLVIYPLVYALAGCNTFHKETIMLQSGNNLRMALMRAYGTNGSRRLTSLNLEMSTSSSRNDDDDKNEIPFDEYGGESFRNNGSNQDREKK